VRPEIYISTAKVADKVLILARTSPREHVTLPPEGMNLFYIDHDSAHVEVRVIEKRGHLAVSPKHAVPRSPPGAGR
jgi:acyl-CoA dehydrogenase